MKTFIVNAARGVVSQKKKLDVTSKLMGREWRMLSDDPSITGKYIFLKDGKLLISVNGLSTYSTWQMATESSLIMDEGVATFLYKVIHIDDNIVVLNLDGTDNFCFLINESSQPLSNATLENIQWYLYRNCNIDLLSPEQKQLLHKKPETICVSSNTKTEELKGDATPLIILIVFGLVVIVLFFIMMTLGLLV
ncbi:MAG: hypothetical protein K2H01_11570 [Ruminococcus sp.]|nr:hypothetical protein [Ruminococcus sp.]